MLLQESKSSLHSFWCNHIGIWNGKQLQPQNWMDSNFNRP